VRSSGLYRWAHFPAIIVFGVLFMLFQSSPWRWQIAIGFAYTVYVFFFAFGSVFKDSDDFLGDSKVPKYFVKLLIPHAMILALIMVGIHLWFRLRPTLPPWVTQEGHKGSLWDLCGWLLLAGAGISQGLWMAGKLKRQFSEPGD
jgi:hypothetical protein